MSFKTPPTPPFPPNLAWRNTYLFFFFFFSFLFLFSFFSFLLWFLNLICQQENVGIHDLGGLCYPACSREGGGWVDRFISVFHRLHITKSSSSRSLGAGGCGVVTTGREKEKAVLYSISVLIGVVWLRAYIH